ncbi:MAG TPA: PQQ-dependent sugar dehydrogenase [Rubricoccaceae bacterium]|jgi:glucose/arabinose dehydrogenase
MIRSSRLAVRALPAALALLAFGAHAQTTSALEPAFPSLSFATPIELTHANDGSGLVYVAEKAGRVRAFANARTTTTATTVLDITSVVQNSGEQGFLGMAFHPNFAANGYLYVHYSGRTDGRTVLARYTRSATNPAVFDPASAQILLTVAQPFSNHNGGKLAFGPDGYLYLSLGDGGSGGDPGNRAQNRTVLLGKLLRFDVDNPAGGLNYGIPPSNPFVGNTDGYREEIYAYGLRNMFKFSFDRTTGQLWGADVGQNSWEEINLVTAGGNYGWRIREGMHCYSPSTGCTTAGLIDPIYEYSSQDGADECSITGGTVYRGARNPDLSGRYLFGDYCTGAVWALAYDGTTATRATLANVGFGLIAFGEDAAGELYMLKEATGTSSIMRFVATAVAGEAEAPAAAPALRLATANPFRNRAVVDVALVAGGRARVTLSDALGRELAVLLDADVAAGERRSVAVDGAGLAPGVYLVRLAAADGTRTTLRLVRAR